MDDLGVAADAALRGELVVIPTDTVYGMGTRPDRADATARLFEAKRRPAGLSLPVLVPSIEAAERIAEVGPAARRLMEAFWPGPLTIVLPRSAGSLDWELGRDAATIGLRRPAHRLAQALLDRTGPLAVSSANISGMPTPPTCRGVAELFGAAVTAMLCDDDSVGGTPSTVVDATGPHPVILRPGPIDVYAVDEALERADP